MGQITLAEQRDRLVGQLQGQGAMIVPLLPKHVRFETVVAQMQKYLHENPKLMEATPASIFWSFVHAAEIGLSVGNFFGEGYVIPYRKKGQMRAQFIPGYRGLIKLAYQSTLVSLISAHVIYEADTFDVDFGRDQEVVCKPALGMQHPGSVVAAYCKIRLSTGATKHDVLPVWRLEAIRRSAPGSSDQGSPWNTHTDEMYRKTVLRHALKDAPKSTEVDRALRLAEQEESELVEVESPDLPGVEARPAGAAEEGRAAKARQRLQERVTTINTTGTTSPEPQPAEQASQGEQEDLFT